MRGLQRRLHGEVISELSFAGPVLECEQSRGLSFFGVGGLGDEE